MHARTRQTWIAAVVLAAVALAAYWYWSPFLVLKQMQSAARAQDAGAFNAHVDYPRLRDSLKEQMATRVTAEMGKAGGGGGSFGAFGAMLGGVMADRLVDALVRPETVMRAMQSGQFGPKAAAPDTASAGTSDAAATPDESAKWTYARTGADRLIAYRADGAAPIDRKMQVVFERSGFANWKLIGVRMPSVQP